MFVRSSKILRVRQLLSPIFQRRGIATSPIAMAPGISDAIKNDHREIETYYDKIINSSDKDEQRRYQNLFTWELARHSIGEELVIYPVFEKLLTDGVNMANKDRKEHLKVSLI
jgi:hemerythrin superfamily protein